MKRLVILIFASVMCTYALAQESGRGRFSILFSQPKYAPGDTVFFTAFQVNQRPIPKTVINLSVVDNNHVEIVNERFLSQDGLSHGQFVVPVSAPSGVYRLALIVEDGLLQQQPVVDLAYFHVSGKNELQKTSGARVSILDTTTLQVTLDRKRYTTRQDVSVLIKNHERVEQTRFAVTVFKKDLMTGSPLVATTLFRQQEQFASVGPRLSIPYYFAGRAFFEETLQPVPDSSSITFYLSESTLTYSVFTKTGGYFSFPMFKHFGTENLYYSISNKGKTLNDCKIEILTPRLQLPTVASAVSDVPDPYWLYARQRMTIDKAYNYQQKQSISVDEFSSDFEVDHEVLMDNLGPFASMEEVFVNVVPMAKPKNGGIRIFLKRDAKYASADPLFLVDGILTDETGWVLSIHPDKIRKIGVLRSPRTLLRFGELGRNGILIIETTSGTDPDIFAKNITIKGFNNPVNTWKTKKPSSPTTPVLGPRLYWNGNGLLKGEASIEFYTADDVGTYTIVIVGYNGRECFYSSIDFEVIAPASQ